MLSALFFTNLYFAVYAFSALAFFASGWLHLDSWKIDRKTVTYLMRSLGFFSVAISFLIASTQSQNQLENYFQNVFSIFGALMIFLGVNKSPILKNPEKNKLMLIALPSFLVVNKLLPFVSVVLFIITTICYFVKSIKGLEKQLRGVSFAFIFLSLAKIFRSLFYWKDSNIVFVHDLLLKHGPVEIAMLVFQLIGIILLIKWIWGYIRFRTEIQLFLSTLSLVLIIFVATTFGFTFTLLKNIEDNVLDSLVTDAKVALYSIERLQFEAMANAKAAAENQQIVSNLVDINKSALYDLTNQYLLNQNLDFLNITDTTGKVIVAAEDEELNNISLSEDPVAKSAIQGTSLATIFKKESASAPIIEVKAASPIKSEEKTIGALVTGFLVDNPLLDGIKEVSGMEVTVYGGDVRSASTVISPDNKTRFIGVKESNTKVVEDVINKGGMWQGKGKIINKNYYLVYLPLKSYSEEVIGMISAGKPESILSQTAQKSIDSTLLGSALLMALSIIPAYFVSKFIQENITA